MFHSKDRQLPQISCRPEIPFVMIGECTPQSKDSDMSLGCTLFLGHRMMFRHSSIVEKER